MDDHQKAIQVDYEKTKKKNVLLHAQISHCKKEMEELKIRSDNNSNQIISKYESSIDSIIKYLIKSNTIKKNSEQHSGIINLLPIKIQN